MLPGMLKKLEERFGVRIRLESQTSNPDEIYRIKGPAGIFWKVQRKRMRGETDYGIGDTQDFFGTTAVVYGNNEQVRKVADWIRIKLIHSGAKFRIDRIAIKDEERETGYRASHIVFEIKVDGVAVPAEIQVRTKEMHEEAKLGRFSHGLREAGISNEEHRRIMENLVDWMGGEFRKSEEIHQTQKMEREKKKGEPREKQRAYTVRILDIREKKTKQEYGKIQAKKGETVGGIVALAVGLENKVKVTDGSVQNGEKTLDFYEKCPPQINLTIEKGNGPGRSTCEKLLKGSVVSPEAVAKIQEHLKKFKKKRWGRK
jgi:ppGpp synthetase/RelA/SpoT-type nucleotidyltranferase